MKVLKIAAGVLAAASIFAGCSKNQAANVPSGEVAAGPVDYTEADLVWFDDFNGSKLDTKSWNYEFHEPGWVNNELQSYDDSAENTYVKDGYLVIQPIKKVSDDGTVSYTSGRVNTQGKHAFTYGRFEARLKVPSGQGYLPAFWMMPDDESFYGQWPKCGEIDIMEVLGHQTDTLYGTLHFGEPHSQDQGTYTLSSGNFSDEFHVFALEWDPGEIRLYCDGIKYKTINDWYTKRPGFGEVTYPAPFDQPFYMIFNVAVGGNWPGYPDATTPFDERAQMVVDYVKVYQKKYYNDDVKKPAKAAVLDSAAGNMIVEDKDKWIFLNAQGGDGKLEVNNGNLDIYSVSDGPVEYAVQVVQGPVPMIKGNIYRYSFDASADEERTIISTVSAPERGWIRYFPDTKVTVTPTTQHFSWDFTMTDDSDAEARLEYNLGSQGSLATVHISNICLEKIGVADLDKGGLGLLPDGNFVHNGQFQEGEGRLENWDIENNAGAEISVTNTKGVRELKVSTPKSDVENDAVTVSQKNLSLPGGKELVLAFDAHASKTCYIGVALADFEKTVKLGKKTAHYEFTYSAELPIKATLLFKAAASGADVYIDNVVVKENSILLNGGFDSGLAGWELYSHENADSEAQAANNAAIVSINKTGNMDWMVQLKQSNILLEKGKKYRVKVGAKSDIDRKIMWALQRDGSGDDNWIPYSGTLVLDVSSSSQVFEHTFSMDYATDPNVIFTISMGAVDGKEINTAHRVIIESVSVEEITNPAAEQRGMVFS